MWTSDLAKRLAISLSVLMPAAADASPAGKPVCRNTPGYLVITREKNGNVGDDILVRRTASAAQKKSSCAFAVRPGDYVLGRGDEAAYVLAMQRRFIALDVGTGPDRQLLIYDVELRKKLVDVPYDDSKSVQVREDRFVYWEIAKNPVKPQSCPAVWRQTTENRDARAAHSTREVTFAFVDGLVRDTGNTGCTRTQDDM